MKSKTMNVKEVLYWLDILRKMKSLKNVAIEDGHTEKQEYISEIAEQAMDIIQRLSDFIEKLTDISDLMR